MEWEHMEWVHVARDRNQWRVFTETAMNLRFL